MRKKSLPGKRIPIAGNMFAKVDGEKSKIISVACFLFLVYKKKL